MNSVPVLVGLSYSPWSERARWALDARNIVYRKKEYQPVIGELGLRRALRKWSGPVSVPMLITETGAIADSFAIAEYANTRGDGVRLFPEGAREVIAHWNNVSEAALGASRFRSLARVLASDDAPIELAPPPMRALPFLARGIGRWGVRRTIRKYGAVGVAMEAHRDVIVRALDELRRALGTNAATEPKTLLGAFSYADITASQALAFISPVESPEMRIGAASRASFHDPELAPLYQDLLAWRNALYQTHRQTGTGSPPTTY